MIFVCMSNHFEVKWMLYKVLRYARFCGTLASITADFRWFKVFLYDCLNS